MTPEPRTSVVLITWLTSCRAQQKGNERVKTSFQFWFYSREFEDSGRTVEVLGHPELRLFGKENVVLSGAVEEGLSQRIQKLPARALQQFIFHEETELRSVQVELPHKANSLISNQALNLPVDVIVSRAKSRPNWRAYVPALNLSLFFRKGKEIETEVPKEILKALMRGDLIRDLRQLVLRVAAESEQSLESIELMEDVPSLKDFIRNQSEKQPRKTPELDRVSDDAAKLIEKENPKLGCYEQDANILRIIETIKQARPRSMVIVGPRGSGKSSIVLEVARRLNLEISQKRPPKSEDDESKEPPLLGKRILLSSGSRIVAGMSALGELEERCDKIIKEAKREQIILHGANLVDLLQAGRHSGSALGVAAYLKEAVSRGDMVLIVEATADELLKAEEMDPGFTGLLERIDVDTPNESESLRILSGVAKDAVVGEVVEFNKDSLKSTLSLHKRFEPYASFPGRCVRFILDIVAEHPLVKDVKLKRQAHRENKTTILDAQHITESFSKQTGLPLWLLQDEKRLIFELVKEKLGARVIGQEGAVSTVSELICRVKAGLEEKEKPLMSLLFVGPTGVGKTEMAKALAEFFFSDTERLIRFDMSEYSNTLAVARLTGSLGTGEGDLTKKLRETPFSVVLFDELEKADSSFFDLLLQVLGEGRLTDAKGRMASFRHSIIIMTSNLGAVSSRRGDLGFNKKGGEQQSRYTEAVEDAFRPELLNRIDTVVPFNSLSPDVIRKITDREIERLLKRDGIMRNELNVSINDEVKDWLAEVGFDEANGARPLKRALEQHIVAPLAEALGRRQALLGRKVTVTKAEGKLHLDLGPPPADGDVNRNPLLLLTDTISTARRRLWRVEAGEKAMQRRNERFMLLRAKERSEAKEKRKKRKNSRDVFDGEKAARLTRIETWLENFQQALRDTEELEELTVQTLLGGSSGEDPAVLEPLIEEQVRACREQLLVLTGFMVKQPNRAFLILSGEPEWLTQLYELYLSVAKKLDFTVTAYQRQSWGLNRSQEGGLAASIRFVRLKPVSEKTKFERPPNSGRLSIGIDIRGPHASSYFHGENGAHWFHKGKNKMVAEVHCASTRPKDEDTVQWQPSSTRIRRVYDQGNRLIKDEVTGDSKAYTKMKMAKVVTQLMETELEMRLEEELK